MTGYGLVVGLIAVTGIAAITGIGNQVDSLFTTVGGELDGVTASSTGGGGAEPEFTPYAFSSHSFTSCGQTGPVGPELADCQSAYSGESWAANTAAFSMDTNGVQSWRVPQTGNYRFTVSGAAGGATYGGVSAGQGGRVIGEMSLTEGDTLHLVVGQAGEFNYVGNDATVASDYFADGGFNGGGGTGNDTQDRLNNGSFLSCGHCNQASGGGASDVRLGGSSLADRVIVAGGGGGGSNGWSGGGSPIPAPGGDGGGLTGQDGGAIDSSGRTYAGGGTQSAGGGKGRVYNNPPVDGTDGSFGQGGRGNRNNAGGGGGGWYGGGGGGGGGGGAGGSSYTAPAVSNVTHSQGVNGGDGSILVELLP